MTIPSARARARTSQADVRARGRGASTLSLVLCSRGFALVLALGLAQPQTAFASRWRGPYVHDYGYSNHGRDWTIGTCPIGMQQSPVDLPAVAAWPSGSFLHDYRPGSLATNATPVARGPAYYLDLFGRGFGGVEYAGLWHPLVSATIHATSEHTWGGRMAQAELHLVHKRHDAGKLLVVATALQAPTSFMGQQAASLSCGSLASMAPSPAFNGLAQAFLSNPGQAGQLDFTSVVSNGTFFAYGGSMTVPPCAEIVTWFVRSDPLMVSMEQLLCLQGLVFNLTSGRGNNRATMPLNGRAVAVLTAQQAPRPDPKTTDAAGPLDANTDRGLRVAATAREALRVAEQVLAT